MLNKPTFFDSAIDIIEDVETGVMKSVNHVTMKCSGMKGDLQKIISRKRGQSLSASSSSSGLSSLRFADLKQVLSNPPNSELQKRREIRSFEGALRNNGSFVNKLNVSIQNQSQSGQDFINYLASQPELKELTIEKELHRINYTLITPEGLRLTDTEQIKSYMVAFSISEPSLLSQEYELLFRAANQSIFGDMIVSLTSFDGLIRPQISAGTGVDDCAILIDLDKRTVRAECFLNISIPNGADGKLDMAGALCVVYFCPASGDVKAKIPYLCACDSLTDQQVNEAAKSMAEMC